MLSHSRCFCPSFLPVCPALQLAHPPCLLAGEGSLLGRAPQPPRFTKSATRRHGTTCLPRPATGWWWCSSIRRVSCMLACSVGRCFLMCHRGLGGATLLLCRIQRGQPSAEGHWASGLVFRRCQLRVSPKELLPFSARRCRWPPRPAPPGPAGRQPHLPPDAALLPAALHAAAVPQQNHLCGSGARPGGGEGELAGAGRRGLWGCGGRPCRQHSFLPTAPGRARGGRRCGCAVLGR